MKPTIMAAAVARTWRALESASELVCAGRKRSLGSGLSRRGKCEYGNVRQVIYDGPNRSTTRKLTIMNEVQPQHLVCVSENR
jgi:hypothetical protein